MKKLLLIDAYAMIFRAYYAFIRTPRMNSKGENTSAIFGFCVTLEDLLKKINPTHVGVAFDPAGGTFRHEAYEQYKAQRPETPEDIRKAVPVIKQLLEAMNIPVLEVPGFEADDVIGTLSVQGEQQGYEVYMATPDKDYGQLVTDHVFMYRPRHTGGFELMGPREVCDKYGVQHKEQIIDLLGLMGDASDNIPGCKGVGEKTAVALLQQFGSIDNMLAHTDEIKGALRTKVESQVEEIKFSRFLATIRTDVPIALDEQLLAKKEPDFEALSALYRDLEFNSLLRKLPQNAPNLPNPQNPPAAPSAPKKSKPSDPAQLDLFGFDEEPIANSQEPTAVFDTVENRLCQYLLNPEVAFNPYKEPDWNALKADADLWNLYSEVELPLVPVLREMEAAGVRINVDKLKQAESVLTQELNELEQKIYSLAGETFNINSPKQVGELLFDKLKLDTKAKKSKTGQYSTSEEVLLGLRERHAIVGAILDFRALSKLITTYISALPSYIAADGKIHTTYNQTVTATGRLSSSNPNLQNLPIRSERGRFIREAVIPDDGCLFLSADYSQIELRLMAHFSQDEHMLAAFRSGQDIHAATAARIYGKPIEQISKDERRNAKTANFGIIYGISAFGLAQQLDCSRTEAKQLIDDYFAAFPRVIQYIENQKEIARQKGYAETLFGRKRYLPDIHSQNATVRSFAERNAVNAPIQGTAADIIKMAMVAIHRRLKEENLQAQMIMQVHDELNFNVPAAEVDRVREIVVTEMQNAVHLSIPLIAECGVGENWLEAH